MIFDFALKIANKIKKVPCRRQAHPTDPFREVCITSACVVDGETERHTSCGGVRQRAAILHNTSYKTASVFVQ